MQSSRTRTLIYGLLGLASMLLSIVGYLWGHKLLVPGALLGVLIAVWQVLAAFILISLAGGIGERLLGSVDVQPLVRLAFAAGLGAIVLSLLMLLLAATVGTHTLVFVVALLIVAILVFRSVLAWWKNLAGFGKIDGGYERFVALGLSFILLVSLAFALAPPTEFDALVYHLSLPLAYLQQDRLVYQPDIMFWGMPQLAELLYLPLMGLAGVEAAPVFMLLVGVVALLGLFGYVRSLFGNLAAWTAVAALAFGESLTRLFSSAYVDWMCMLFGLSALAALHAWLERRDRKMLILLGVFCGGALSTKYSAGILLIGVIVALALLRDSRSLPQLIGDIFVVGLTATVISSPWWIKNYVATGNPFYPFIFPTVNMDLNRLHYYAGAPAWRDWRAVILLPWQATFLGISGKEGFSASIGALLVGLSPLAWIGWRSRTDSQRRLILVAAIVTVVGLLIWGIGSRLSGLLIQTRLYLVFFPAWAVLAGVGFDAIQGLKSTTVRFGRLLTVLVVVILALNIFSLATQVTSQNPGQYILRQEDQRSYLYRNTGAYAAAMDAVNGLPSGSRVLMLWETRGFYCQPRCNSDEVIDRWYDDVRLYGTAQAVVAAWRSQGYTDLLVFDLGRDFVRTEVDPQEQVMRWSVLDSTLASLPVEQHIGDGAYTLYRIP